MSLSDVLDNPALYRVWQAPFARQKIQPVINSGIVDVARSVLDVGCGPGTNAALLGSVARYVGIDLNESYINYARTRYDGEFIVADVTDGLSNGEQFDLVLMNSLMHHLDDVGAGALLQSLDQVVAPNGEIHVLDLVLAQSGIPRRMALADRGDFPRTPEQWEDLVANWLSLKSSSIYGLGVGPLEMWTMIHLILEPRR